MLKTFSKVKPPESVTRTVTECDVLVSKLSSAPFATTRLLPLSAKRPPALLMREKAALSPASGSVALKAPTTVPLALFSATLEFDSELAVGASSTLVTAIANILSKVIPPLSVTRTVTEWDVVLSKFRRLPFATTRLLPLAANRPPALLVREGRRSSHIRIGIAQRPDDRSIDAILRRGGVRQRDVSRCAVRSVRSECLDCE